GHAIAVDAQGNAYVCGYVDSLDFPTTAGSLQPANANHEPSNAFSGFLTKLNPTGTALVYSTYISGGPVFVCCGESVTDIAVDNLAQVFMLGATTSSTFPTTVGAFQRTLRGSNDIFVA